MPDSIPSDNGPQFAAVLWQRVLKTLGIDTYYATFYHPQTKGQVERFNRTLIKQLRHYVSDHVVTWSRYLSLVVTAYNSQVHSSTGQIPFAFVSPQRLTPVALERPTAGTGPGKKVTPGRAKENFLQRLSSLIPLVRDTMEKAQARYKRAFDKRVQTRREALINGDMVFVTSHENQGGKLVFNTLGPYQILKTDGRRHTIESDDGIRTINGNHATRAPEPPEGDRAWARALTAWRAPLLNRSGDGGCGTTVKWLSGLSLCVCVRTCFVGCPKVRPPLPTESTSQIVPTGPSAPSSHAHTDAHALAPNRITPQIKSH